MNLQTIKAHLEDFGLSTSCEGAGRGGSKKLLCSRLKSFLFNGATPLPANPNGDTPLPPAVEVGWFEDFQIHRKLLKRVPHGSRTNCSKALCKVLKNLIKNNDKKSWFALLCFTRCCLSNPYRGGRKNNSLATVIDKKIINFEKEIWNK